MKSNLPEAPPYDEDDLAHLARLTKLKALEYVDIRHCPGVTAEARARFRELRPGCRLLPDSE